MGDHYRKSNPVSAPTSNSRDGEKLAPGLADESAISISGPSTVGGVPAWAQREEKIVRGGAIIDSGIIVTK